MWEDLKSASITLFFLLYWVHGSFQPWPPVWAQGWGTEQLPSPALVWWKRREEREKERQKKAKKQGLAGGREKAEPSYPCLSPAHPPRCSLKSALNQHPGSVAMERGGNSLKQR